MNEWQHCGRVFRMNMFADRERVSSGREALHAGRHFLCLMQDRCRRQNSTISGGTTSKARGTAFRASPFAEVSCFRAKWKTHKNSETACKQPLKKCLPVTSPGVNMISPMCFLPGYQPQPHLRRRRCRPQSISLIVIRRRHCTTQPISIIDGPLGKLQGWVFLEFLHNQVL